MHSKLIELNPGVVDGMTQEEIRAQYPEDYRRSLEAPFAHRYPRGESYHDLCVRRSMRVSQLTCPGIEPFIFELERDRSDILLIGHASVLRACYSYLRGLAPSDSPSVDLRRGDVVEITPSSYGVTSKTHRFSDEEGLLPPSENAFACSCPYDLALTHADGSPAAPTSMLSKMALRDNATQDSSKTPRPRYSSESTIRAN